MSSDPAHRRPPEDLEHQLAGLVDDLVAEAEQIVREAESGSTDVGGATAGALEGSDEDEALSAAVADLLATGVHGPDDRAPSERAAQPVPPLSVNEGGVRPPDAKGEAPEPEGEGSASEGEDEVALERSLASLTADLMAGCEGGEADPAPTSDAGEVGGTFEPIQAVPPAAHVPNAAASAVPPTPAKNEDDRQPEPAAAVRARSAAGGVAVVRQRVGRVARRAGRAAGPLAHAAGRRGARGLGVAGRASAPMAARVLVLVSAPLQGRPKSWRDSVGWLAMGTLFLAIATWFFVLVRQPAGPERASTGDGLVVTAQDAGSGAG